MDPDVIEPHLIRDAGGLSRALAAVKGPRSYRALTAAAEDLTPSSARERSGVSDWKPESLSRGTVSDWVAGRGVPTRAKMLTFLVVCEVPADQVPAWLETLERIRGERRVEPAPVEPPSGAGRPWFRRRTAQTVAAVVATVVVIGVGVAITRGVSGGGRAEPPVPTTAPAPVCDVAADGRAVVAPRVTSVGAAAGLTFCPVRLNDGKLPITGPFALAGQVLGPVAQRALLVLVVWGDPRTCDALGNPPAKGVFLAGDVDLGSTDGRWTRVDALGYSEAVTLGRQYRYLSASPRSLEAIRGDARAWVAAHPDNPDDYPGILALPADAQELATFDVPPGVYRDAKPCRET